MNRILCLAFLVPAVSLGQSLEFKGNPLGMSLADFKAKNAIGKVTLNDAPPNWRGVQNKKFKRTYSLPLCTNEVNVFPGSNQTVLPGEVLCNASPWGYYEGKMVAGSPIEAVYYRFYEGKLYYIELEFDQSRFVEIIRAFEAKYGKPDGHGKDSFINAYGAAWEGATVAWLKDKQAIVAREGSEGGPAQRLFAPGTLSKIAYYDPAIAPPPTKPTVDF